MRRRKAELRATCSAPAWRRMQDMRAKGGQGVRQANLDRLQACNSTFEAGAGGQRCGGRARAGPALGGSPDRSFCHVGFCVPS